MEKLLAFRRAARRLHKSTVRKVLPGQEKRENWLVAENLGWRLVVSPNLEQDFDGVLLYLCLL